MSDSEVIRSSALVYPIGTTSAGQVVPPAVWIVKKTYTPAHQCYVVNMQTVWEDHIDEGSVVQCSECLSFWRLYYLADLPNWEQVVEDEKAKDGFKPLRSRIVKFRNTTYGGWSRPWKVSA